MSDNAPTNDSGEQSDGTFEFAMGEFTAEFRLDRQYAKNHMWALHVSENTWRFGLTAYAVRLLQDVYFLDWIIDPPAEIEHRSQIGSIESKKAESDLFAPISGIFSSINDQAISDPSVINADCYGDGWLIEMISSEPKPVPLLSPDQYREHLFDAWEIAQKTIKGQANT